MSYFTIRGGTPLEGTVSLQCAKNSVLPILAATLLHRGTSRIVCCPRLRDVDTASQILRHLGCRVAWDGPDLVVDAACLTSCCIPQQLMCRCRASALFLGALLGRCGEAEACFPGGCALGPRPIDLHLSVLRALGGHITEDGTALRCRAAALHGCRIRLPFPSVGATENAVLAAAAAEGTTVIEGAAQEPEIADLQSFLQKMGVHITGGGSTVITVEGSGALRDCAHRCIGDRIVAATYLCAAAACGGTVHLQYVQHRHLRSVLTALEHAGCGIVREDDGITLSSQGILRAIPAICTAPYPAFPTDAQPLLMAALLRAEGCSEFTETVFDDRFRHVPLLRRMGADIRLTGRTAAVYGVTALHGADVCATDLRCGAALAVAALQCDGISHIHGTHHILRGYEDLAGDLRSLGADITMHRTHHS